MMHHNKQQKQLLISWGKYFLLNLSHFGRCLKVERSAGDRKENVATTQRGKVNTSHIQRILMVQEWRTPAQLVLQSDKSVQKESDKNRKLIITTGHPGFTETNSTTGKTRQHNEWFPADWSTQRPRRGLEKGSHPDLHVPLSENVFPSERGGVGV